MRLLAAISSGANPVGALHCEKVEMPTHSLLEVATTRDYPRSYELLATGEEEPGLPNKP